MLLGYLMEPPSLKKTWREKSSGFLRTTLPPLRHDGNPLQRSSSFPLAVLTSWGSQTMAMSGTGAEISP